jgi:hypothetical protein
LFPGLLLAQEQPVVGYQAQESEIVFTFDPTQHEYVIQEDDGNVLPLSDITVHQVTLAGEFNAWQANSLAMEPDDDGVYRLTLTLDSLRLTDTQFAFVINDYYWVEPLLDAVNRVPAPCWLVSTGAVYTTLLHEFTVQQLMSDTVLTDETARQWLMNYATPMHTHTPAGLETLKRYVKGKQAIAIGHDTVSTYVSRSRVAQYLLAGMEYPVMAFQLDSTRATHIMQYLDDGFSVLDDDYTMEVIRVLEWSYDHPEVALMGYEREDITTSLNRLSQVARQVDDEDWQNEVSTLVGEVRSLLDAQQKWGLYYYDSPSFQEFLLLELCSVRDNLPDLSENQRVTTERSLTVVNRYITNLTNLKSYYRSIQADLTKYFDWLNASDSSLQLVAWVPNEEMSRNTPGSLGQYLSERYQDNYLAVGVGMFRFQEEPVPVSLERRFPSVDRNGEEGNSAYIIDVRQANLSPDEMKWLGEKMFHRSGDQRRTLSEDFDIILLINEPETLPVLR